MSTTRNDLVSRGCWIEFRPKRPHHTLCDRCYHGAKAREHIELARQHQARAMS